MAAELKEELGIDTDLIKGSGGVFEVHLDGALIFSKIAIGRFPETEEIISLVRKSMKKT